MTRNKFISALILSIALLTNCTKNDPSSESLLNNNANNQAIRGDNEWDVLGHGYNVMGQYLEPDNVSKAPILDIKRFRTDYTAKVSNPTGTIIDSEFYFGSNASNFVKMLNTERKFNASASIGNKDSLKSGGQYFSASFSSDKTNQSLKEVASRFSYARHESTVEVRKVYFTDDVSADLLRNYLTADFTTNVATYNAEQLIQLYGTHVLMDISLGGRLIFNFTSNYSSELNQEKKITKTKGGLGFLAKKIGIDISIEQTKEEMTKNYYEGNERNSKIRIYGGSTSGKTISFDKDGNASEAINLGAWEQSVNPTNSFLLDIKRMVPLYHFITDPTKRAQVKAAIEKYIMDRQITELGEVPVYSMFFDASLYKQPKENNNHVLSLNPNNEDWAYINEGIMFYALTEPKAGTIPIYRYRRDKINNNFFTKDLGNYTDYRNEGIAFYAFPTSTSSITSNLTPIYRHWSDYHMDHYYTPTAGTFPRYNFEKIEFYGIKAN